MKLQRLVYLAAIPLAIAIANPAFSYEVTSIGGKFGFIDPEGREGAPSWDVNLEMEQEGSALHLVPGFSYWKKDGLSDKNPNFDLYYHFLPQGEVSPYLGAGVGMHFYNAAGSDRDETDPGANFFGGLRFPGRVASLYLEGRYVATELSQALVRGGVSFNLDELSR